ncbi:GNAT family N-acetyltransferase [Bacillus sp. 31A1R]|uniref:GNAT family N-acetyltransferase n=1 Tax=Robertmurraya mangrovi TaxID=3098077 RepID=A0ABU5J2B6_9BACI|nr:GNAT family N-acetyltransferase [Bacillus sp. 31A1R]MDZ5473565.1 GNAT family N-acetyltransferase [Bacillus sp. 31A1R]
MITELKKEEYYKCKPIINVNGQAEVKAIVDGNSPGRIFVDNVDSPKSGLIWQGNNDGFYFIGDENNEEFNKNLNQLIETVIAPQAREMNLEWFEGISNHPGWYVTIKEVFAHKTLGSWNQKVFTLEEKNYQLQNEKDIEANYEIKRITRELYYDQSIINLEFLHAKLHDFWPNPEDFFDKGKGFCAMYENKVVSVCFSALIYEQYHCVDIETLKDHRGKKLAQKVAHYFVRECLEHKLTPYWDCMEGNKPSVALAEGLGFTNSFNYVGYEFSLK